MSALGAPPQRVDYAAACAFATAVFAAHDVPVTRARVAAEALCYGDLTGHASHGLVNLARIYLPKLRSGQINPYAELTFDTDLGAAVRVDAGRALGLWSASVAMDVAVERARRFGIGMVALRGGTHFGCAGHHALRAVDQRMVGIVAANCGHQRIVPPPGSARPLLGTNPLSVAAPAGDRHPFVLDMSTSVVPTGRIRQAAVAGEKVPVGWLQDSQGNSVTDPSALDEGKAQLLWLGGPGAAAYKGFGLGLAVELLAAVCSGAGTGPPSVLTNGTGSGDEDIGCFFAAIAIEALRPAQDVRADSQAVFDAVLDCPGQPNGAPTSYPGWHEAELAQLHRRRGIPITSAVAAQLQQVADELRLPRLLIVAEKPQKLEIA